MRVSFSARNHSVQAQRQMERKMLPTLGGLGDAQLEQAILHLGLDLQSGDR